MCDWAPSSFALCRVVNVREEVATVRSSRAAKPRPRDQRVCGGIWQQQQQHNASRGNKKISKRPASAGQGGRQRRSVPTGKSGRSSNAGFDPEHLRHRVNRSLSSSSVGPLGSILSDNYDNEEDAEMHAKSLCMPRAVNRVELVHREAQGGRPVSAGGTRGFGDHP